MSEKQPSLLRRILLGQGGNLHPSTSFNDFGMHVQNDAEREIGAAPTHLISAAQSGQVIKKGALDTLAMYYYRF